MLTQKTNGQGHEVDSQKESQLAKKQKYHF